MYKLRKGAEAMAHLLVNRYLLASRASVANECSFRSSFAQSVPQKIDYPRITMRTFANARRLRAVLFSV